MGDDHYKFLRDDQTDSAGRVIRIGNTERAQLMSFHEELRPDIVIRVGKKPEPCHVCGKRAIYALPTERQQEVILCGACALQTQRSLNRLKGE